MTLNHVNVPVEDVVASSDFFKKYFDMTTVFEAGKPNITAVGLADKAGNLLNLSHFDEDGASPIAHHRDFHLGFFVDTDAEVDAVYSRIIGDGVPVHGEPEREFGRYTFYIKSPGGFDVEVACLGAALKRRTVRNEPSEASNSA
jgi:catechol 2,3-dioxygenase-like lactoylglutathione lyase family enzyme